MASVLYRVGRFAYAHRRLVLATWLAVLAGVTASAAGLKASTVDTFSVPGTESERALSLLDRQFPGSGGAVARIVFAAPPGHTLTEPRFQALIGPTVTAARRVPQTVGGTKAFLGSLALSRDRRIAFADLHFAVPVAQIATKTRNALEQVAGPARTAGLEIAFSGGVVSTTSSGDGAPELVGVVAAFIILAITFSSILAAGLPLATALLGVAIGLAGIEAATGLVTLNSSTPTLAVMLGLAVGIDYALFIVSRVRQGIETGMSVSEAVPRAVATAGSAVAFAGTTVVIALVGLSVVGIPFLGAMGIAAAGTIVIAVLIALTLLPALIGFAGGRVARRHRPLPQRTLGRRWAELVTRHPVLALGAVLAAFAVSSVPALHIRQALPDDGSKPSGTTERRAYDLLTTGFGPGFTGPLTVVVDATGKPNPRQIGERAVQLLGRVPNVAGVAGPVANASGDISIVQVTPKSSPSATATTNLVKLIRRRAAAIRARYGVGTYVTGQTAVNIDTSTKLTSALPVFIVVVVGLAVLLLIVLFRSLLVPVVALGGFLMSVAAALGATTFVFQDGHGLSALGLDRPDPIVSFVPVFIVAILFGLSMDYEVFLVTRMREAYTRGENASEATVTGFSESARVVTAAALIMVSVFSAFVSSDALVIKSLAFALAFGILFDAFLVRMTAIPAVHQLLGDRAWWLPSGLDRRLPNLDVEGNELAPAAVDLEREQRPVGQPA
jgi:putative drug exporter of the RND superfamily